MTIIAAILMLFGNVYFVVHDLSDTRAIVEVSKGTSRWIALKLKDHQVIGMEDIDPQQPSLCKPPSNRQAV